MGLMSGLSKVVSTRGDNKPWKNGNNVYSVFGELDGQRVKVYQCFNKAQVSLRWWIESQPEHIRKFFPRIIKVEGLLVAEEYIEGRSINSNAEQHSVRKDLEKLMRDLKRFKYDHMTWDYLDYICERSGVPNPNLTHKHSELNRINHNDLTKENLVISNKNNQVVIIDNEFLACNNSAFMNKKNSDILEEDLYDVTDYVLDEYWRIRKMYDKSLIDEHYTGSKARTYDQGRNKNPKWKFEQKCVEQFIEEHKDIRTVIDAPLGTNRFASIFKSSDHIEKVYGYEYAEDMILEAEKNSFDKLSIHMHDLITKRITIPADLGLCIRMLNLFPENESLRILGNVLQASTKYCILTLRCWDKLPKCIDGKIWVQNESKFDSFIEQEGWTITDKGFVDTPTDGNYKTFILTKDS